MTGVMVFFIYTWGLITYCIVDVYGIYIYNNLQICNYIITYFSIMQARCGGCAFVQSSRLHRSLMALVGDHSSLGLRCKPRTEEHVNFHLQEIAAHSYSRRLQMTDLSSYLRASYLHTCLCPIELNRRLNLVVMVSKCSLRPRERSFGPT